MINLLVIISIMTITFYYSHVIGMLIRYEFVDKREFLISLIPFALWIDIVVTSYKDLE